jgi:hypothetical protein
VKPLAKYASQHGVGTSPKTVVAASIVATIALSAVHFLSFVVTRFTPLGSFLPLLLQRVSLTAAVEPYGGGANGTSQEQPIRDNHS